MVQPLTKPTSGIGILANAIKRKASADEIARLFAQPLVDEIREKNKKSPARILAEQLVRSVVCYVKIEFGGYNLLANGAMQYFVKIEEEVYKSTHGVFPEEVWVLSSDETLRLLRKECSRYLRNGGNILDVIAALKEVREVIWSEPWPDETHRGLLDIVPAGICIVAEPESPSGYAYSDVLPSEGNEVPGCGRVYINCNVEKAAQQLLQKIKKKVTGVIYLRFTEILKSRICKYLGTMDYPGFQNDNSFIPVTSENVTDTDTYSYGFEGLTLTNAKLLSLFRKSYKEYIAMGVTAKKALRSLEQLITQNPRWVFYLEPASPWADVIIAPAEAAREFAAALRTVKGVS